MIQDVRDRVPINVLNNGAIRYAIYDYNNNFLRYEYIKRDDGAIEEGTPLNRKTWFDSILQFASKYQEGRVEKTFSSEVYPVWTGSGTSSSMSAPFTNSGSVSFSTSGTNTASYGFYSIVPICVREILVSGTTGAVFTIQSSNDGINWRDLYNSTEALNSTELKVEFENNEEYNMYVISTQSSSGNTISRFDITKWKLGSSEFKGELFYSQMTTSGSKISFCSAIMDLPIPYYEEDMRISTRFMCDFTENKYTYNSIIPTLTALTENGYEITSSPSMSNLLYAFNSATDNATGSSNTLYEITMKLPQPKVATRLYVAGDMVGGTASSSRAGNIKYLYASNDGSNWVTVMPQTNTHTENGGVTLNFPNTVAYSYYKLGLKKTAGRSGNLYVGSIKLYERVVSQVDFSELHNVMLNINNLGARNLVKHIVPSQRYNLVYENEEWNVDIIDIITGYFTKPSGSSNSATILLGKTPKLVITYSASNNGYAVGHDYTGDTNYSVVPRILSRAYTTSYGSIISGGFTCSGNTNVTSTVYYVAIL